MAIHAAIDISAASARQETERFTVFALYEDLPTGLRAKMILDRLSYRLGAGLECRSDWWRLDLLGNPALDRESLEKVSAADLILISAHGTTGALQDVEHWFARWTHRGHKQPGALVLSLDTEARKSARGQRTLLRLRVVSAKAGLAMFPHFGQVPRGNDTASLVEIHMPEAEPAPEACPIIRVQPGSTAVRPGSST